ncbi:hypothetical protein ACES27_004577 [Salmonella enterica]
MAVRYDIFTTREDGEVMLDELMSADWTALQVNVMPLDSSGAYTPLVSGTVSVKVSPFESGNYWIDVNNNNYYGVALRLKIIKTELPAAVSSLRVSVWRAGVSPQSVVNLQPDVALSDITTQSYIERANKQGKLFTASRRVTDVAGSSNLDSIFITGTKQVVFNQRIIGYTGKGVVASIYRGAVANGGTAAEINNPNDITPQAATAQLLTGAVTNIGQLTVAATYSEGNASNQGQGNSQAKLGEQIIMAPNTTYLLRITSLDTAVQNINAYVSWFEDDTYLV